MHICNDGIFRYVVCVSILVLLSVAYILLLDFVVYADFSILNMQCV